MTFELLASYAPTREHVLRTQRRISEHIYNGDIEEAESLRESIKDDLETMKTVEDFIKSIKDPFIFAFAKVHFLKGAPWGILDPYALQDGIEAPSEAVIAWMKEHGVKRTNTLDNANFNQYRGNGS